MTPPPLVLASGSPRRRELLALLRIPFEVLPSAFDEPSPAEVADPAAFARHLALEKARDVAQRRPDALVIGADTVVALGNTLFAKPADEADAVRMIAALAGRTHAVITAVALVSPGREECFHVHTAVTFRPLTPRECQAYVACGESLDKAGAYASQSAGALLIQRIEGDHSNVIGLPISTLLLHLRDLGYRCMEGS